MLAWSRRTRRHRPAVVPALADRRPGGGREPPRPRSGRASRTGAVAGVETEGPWSTCRATDGAHELSADLPEDTAVCDAGDLVDHFADDAPPEEGVPARTGDARALIGTAPGGRGSGHAKRCRLVGDPHLRNGVRDENVGAERRARPCRPPLRACAATGIPATSVATKAASSRDVPSSVVRADGFRVPCRSDLRAATGSFPSPSGTGVNDPRDWGQGGFLNWGQALRPISAIALHRDSAIAKTAFPQGKILGERRRNRGRSPL